jgi:hypothetical protein
MTQNLKVSAIILSIDHTETEKITDPAEELAISVFRDHITTKEHQIQ